MKGTKGEENLTKKSLLTDPSDIKNAASPKLLETSKEKKSCLVILSNQI